MPEHDTDDRHGRPTAGRGTRRTGTVVSTTAVAAFDRGATTRADAEGQSTVDGRSSRLKLQAMDRKGSIANNGYVR